MKLSPIEIGKIRQGLPYLRRHMKVPAWLERAVSGTAKPPKISNHEVKRLVLALMSGSKRVVLDDNRFVIGGKRGPGRPPGSAASHSRKTVANTREHPIHGKRKPTLGHTEEYVAAVTKVTASTRAKVKRVKPEKGNAAATKTAAAPSASATSVSSRGAISIPTADLPEPSAATASRIMSATPTAPEKSEPPTASTVVAETSVDNRTPPLGNP